MKIKITLAACMAACMSLSSSVFGATTFDYANTTTSVIQFAGDGTFTISPIANNFQVTDGTASGLTGDLTGTFTIGTITTIASVNTAPVTGTGTLVIHDGVNDLKATVEWIDIAQSGTLDFLNTSGTVNLTGITYAGSNPDLVALKNAGTAVNVFSFQFTPAVALSDLKTSSHVTSFSGTITASSPPPCNCSLTFGGPLTLTNCAGDAIPNLTASEDCGSGATPVLVTVTGSSTSGVCPQIIVRTNTATDDCGKVYTQLQTITVNCQPDCTVTTSVKTTIVGTTGLTASVPDAGAGASYSWNVVNGTITAGQDTDKITFTAGSDTSNPITIVVTVTAATGCNATCTGSVGVTPPPTTNVGPGDTATIGFWNNKNGQAVILGAANQPALGNWLASNYPCMFGNLAGKSNNVVAALFQTDFSVKGQKTYAQVLGGALACYFTSSSLGGGTALTTKFGFNVSPGGTGSKTYNVGSLGTVLGLQNNQSYTVQQLLQAADANCPFSQAVFDALNTIFSDINQTGDIKS